MKYKVTLTQIYLVENLRDNEQEAVDYAYEQLSEDLIGGHKPDFELTQVDEE
jgi:hypothetical protein